MTVSVSVVETNFVMWTVPDVCLLHHEVRLTELK